jgi:hypothetical protein
MLSVRSVVQLAVLVLVVSVAGAAVSLLKEPNSRGKGHDSYGVQRYGFKAFHDTLHDLGLVTRRGLHPPRPVTVGETLLLLKPDQDLVATEPAYLRALESWVAAGGRVVVAAFPPPVERFRRKASEGQRPTLLESLGLPHVSVKVLRDVTGATTRRTEAPSIEEIFVEAMGQDPQEEMHEPDHVCVTCAGTFAGLSADVRNIALPGGRRFDVQWSEDNPPVGTVRVHEDCDGDGHWVQPDSSPDAALVAEFSRGRGSIVVVAEPGLFSNHVLALGDNSPLCVGICSPQGGAVEFDEFYHGLSVRGNVLYLLTIPGFLALALGMLAVACMVNWREAIFLGPPLEDQDVRRRDIGEYIAAMARFFSIGRDARPYLVEKLRDGVQRELCKAYSLPQELHDVDSIARRIERLQPQRAEQFRRTMSEIREELSSRGTWSEAATLSAMQRLTKCLSKTV